MSGYATTDINLCFFLYVWLKIIFLPDIIILDRRDVCLHFVFKRNKYPWDKSLYLPSCIISSYVRFRETLVHVVLQQTFKGLRWTCYLGDQFWACKIVLHKHQTDPDRVNQILYLTI